MCKVEELALKVYPKMSRISEPHEAIPADNQSHYIGDANAEKREGFINGYHQAEKDLSDKARLSSGWAGFYYGQGYKQAEKDLELTWKDIQLIVSLDWDLDHSEFSCGKSTEEYYKEVLKQFNEEREK